MRSYVSLMRPFIGIIAIGIVWFGTLLAGATLFPSVFVLYGLLSVFLITSGCMVINDIYDIHLDKHNKPHRPLPSERASTGKAKLFALILFIAGNFFTLLMGRDIVIFSIVVTIMFVAYSAKLKRNLVSGYIIISIILALGFLFGGLLVDNLFAPLWLAVPVLVANIGREIFKSIDDMLSDKKAGIESLALRYGVLKTKTIASIIMIITVIITFLPYIMGVKHELYLFFAIVSDILFVTAIGVPVKYSNRFSKIGLLVLVFAFFISLSQMQHFLA